MALLIEILYKIYYMAHIYSEKSSDYKMNPSRKTIEFILDFSKSLKVIRTQDNSFIEMNLN